jgi:hypothetical protein
VPPGKFWIQDVSRNLPNCWIARLEGRDIVRSSTLIINLDKEYKQDKTTK